METAITAKDNFDLVNKISGYLSIIGRVERYKEGAREFLYVKGVPVVMLKTNKVYFNSGNNYFREERDFSEDRLSMLMGTVIADLFRGNDLRVTSNEI